MLSDLLLALALLALFAVGVWLGYQTGYTTADIEHTLARPLPLDDEENDDDLDTPPWMREDSLR